MSRLFRVVVLGEGRDERGGRRKRAPFTPVPHGDQGAMEILVRRALYPLLTGQPWHKGLKDSDGIQILQPPVPQRPISMVEAITHERDLSFLAAGALSNADLLVVTHDADAGAEAASRAVFAVSRDLNTRVPLLLPAPEIQAWLTRKRAIEQAYGREYCTVPEPDEEALRRDAKAELQRLLGTFGGKFNARMQASLAEYISTEDLARYDWSGWSQVPELLKEALAVRALAPPIP